MKNAFYTNSVSAHQLPLAREIFAHVGSDQFRYIYTGDSLQGGGQEESGIGEDEVDDWLENADVLMSGLRDVELFVPEDKIVDWGYFVEKGSGVRGHELEGGVQMRFSLTLVGDGPEKERLQKFADKLQKKSTRHRPPPPLFSTFYLMRILLRERPTNLWS